MSVIAYGESANKSKETVLDMCFVAHNYMLIATSERTYHVHVSDVMVAAADKNKNASLPKMACIGEDEDDNGDNDEHMDALEFMTSSGDNGKRSVIAQPTYVESVSENQTAYQDDVVANKFIYYNNLICMLVYFIFNF